jgi:hypothetical protein
MFVAYATDFELGEKVKPPSRSFVDGSAGEIALAFWGPAGAVEAIQIRWSMPIQPSQVSSLEKLSPGNPEPGSPPTSTTEGGKEDASVGSTRASEASFQAIL